MSRRKLRVAVTSLADFSCKTGNLESSGVAGPTAQEGIRAHQRIQKAKDVAHEVRLKTLVETDDYLLTLNGRVDLLDEKTHTISEIKTNYVPVDIVSDAQRNLHWAQVKLYAYCYWRELSAEKKEGRDSLKLELIYINLRDNTETILVESCVWSEIESFALQAINRYLEWQDLVWTSQQATISTAKAIAFPHAAFRAGQRDMAAAIFRSSRDKQTLLCEAPTGTGKTISALFPVVKSIAEKQVKQVLYLTAKTSGRASAMNSIQRLTQQGLKVSSVVIRSKSLSCFCSTGACERNDEGVCPMTLGFFDRLPAARAEAFSEGVIDASLIDEIAWQHQLCPFEFSLQMLPWVSITVCDYNYIYDPLVRLGRFNEPRKDTTVLIDEAHNLLDRSRSMYSGTLLRSACDECAKASLSQHPRLHKAISQLSKDMLKHAKSQVEPTVVDIDKPVALLKSASNTLEHLLEAMAEKNAFPEQLFEFFKSVCRFLVIGELYNDAHRTLTSINEASRRKEVEVHLKCVDAAGFMQPQFARFSNTVLFSATLRPSEFFRDSLGLPEHTVQLQLDSPFDPNNACLQVLPFINTRYAQRNASADTLVDVLEVMVSAEAGNYMVFFPSYAYMKLVYDVYVSRNPDKDCWIQTRQSSNEEREAILAMLATEGCRLGFAILGGVFGEGVDYIGQLLIGVAVVGVGLPGLGTEQDLIAEQYQKKGFDGYDYAYRYPGLTRVLQTVGRVIRTESDRGVVLLIDDRFDHAFYRSLYPKHWRVNKVRSIQHLSVQLSSFWANTAE